MKRLVLCSALFVAACTDEDPTVEVVETELTAEDQALFEGLEFPTDEEAAAAARDEITAENADEAYLRLLEEIEQDS